MSEGNGKSCNEISKHETHSKNEGIRERDGTENEEHKNPLQDDF